MKTDTYKKYNGNRALKIETLLTGQKYALSINPVLQPERADRFRVYTWYRKMYEFFQNFYKSVTLILYPEVSPTGRWHFHGTLVICEFIGYVDFLTELGKVSHYEIDTIATDSKLAWGTYCEKQANVWKALFADNLYGYPMMIGKKYKALREAVAPSGKDQTGISKYLSLSEDSSSDQSSPKHSVVSED